MQNVDDGKVQWEFASIFPYALVFNQQINILMICYQLCSQVIPNLNSSFTVQIFNYIKVAHAQCIRHVPLKNTVEVHGRQGQTSLPDSSQSSWSQTHCRFTHPSFEIPRVDSFQPQFPICFQTLTSHLRRAAYVCRFEKLLSYLDLFRQNEFMLALKKLIQKTAEGLLPLLTPHVMYLLVSPLPLYLKLLHQAGPL